MQRDVIHATRVSAIRGSSTLALLSVLLTACGGGSPSAPTPAQPVLTIVSITPAIGTTSGGTEVRLSGANFADGAAVMIGGAAATNVRVLGTTTIQAVTGARGAGVTDVVVVLGSRIATLPSAFTYVAPPVPTVTAIAPTSGSTAGGTEVTLTGTNFAAGAAVTIGGVAASNVRVSGPTTILAVTGAHPAGVAGVAVTVDGQTATLASAFTFVAPPPNTLPVITALTVQGSRLNEPANFADLGEDVALTATVRDVETPVDQLLFDWSADAGTITGSGASVRWRAPSALAVPAQVRVSVRVTEIIQAVAAGAVTPVLTQSVTASATVRVHDSLKEIRDLSMQFLVEFSNSDVPPDSVVRNFWDGCPGKAAELSDVVANRALFRITSFNIGAPTSASINFQGTCAFRNKRGVDGCVMTPVEWHSIRKESGATETAIGSDQTTAVYRDSRWWLCDSDFDGKVTNPFAAVPFIR